MKEDHVKQAIIYTVLDAEETGVEFDRFLDSLLVNLQEFDFDPEFFPGSSEWVSLYNHLSEEGE